MATTDYAGRNSYNGRTATTLEYGQSSGKVNPEMPSNKKCQHGVWGVNILGFASHCTLCVNRKGDEQVPAAPDVSPTIETIELDELENESQVFLER